MKKIRKIALLALLSIFFLPRIVSAQPVGNITITQLLFNVQNIIWIIAAVIILALWVITGLLFLTALGEPKKLETARHALFAAVGGTAIVILAYSAINIIGNALFQGR